MPNAGPALPCPAPPRPPPVRAVVRGVLGRAYLDDPDFREAVCFALLMAVQASERGAGGSAAWGRGWWAGSPKGAGPCGQRIVAVRAAPGCAGPLRPWEPPPPCRTCHASGAAPAAAQGCLKRYGTSVEADEALLAAGGELGWRRTCAVRVRLGEKRLLGRLKADVMTLLAEGEEGEEGSGDTGSELGSEEDLSDSEELSGSEGLSDSDAGPSGSEAEDEPAGSGASSEEGSEPEGEAPARVGGRTISRAASLARAHQEARAAPQAGAQHGADQQAPNSHIKTLGSHALPLLAAEQPARARRGKTAGGGGGRGSGRGSKRQKR